MVDAAVAGVLFTANPVTGRRHEAVIDASPGLGEAVVSGAVNPDHFVVDGATGSILERARGQGPADPSPARRRNRAPDAARRRIAAVPGRCPVAARWHAWAAARSGTSARRRTSNGPSTPDGTAWLTQSRPITTLYPLPVRPRVRAGDARLSVLQPGPGADPAPDADGPGRYPADCLLRGGDGAFPGAGSPGRARRRTRKPGSASSSTSPPWSGARPGGRSFRGCSTSWRPGRPRCCAGCSPIPGSPSCRPRPGRCCATSPRWRRGLGSRRRCSAR